MMDYLSHANNVPTSFITRPTVANFNADAYFQLRNSAIPRLGMPARYAILGAYNMPKEPPKKKRGRPKYQKPKIPGSVSHIKPFSPPKLISTGRDALFNDDLYKIPKLPETTKNSMSLRERIEYEKAHRKNPFTYNKLMNTATFSPAISSFTCNLKREFPTICFH